MGQQPETKGPWWARCRLGQCFLSEAQVCTPLAPSCGPWAARPAGRPIPPRSPGWNGGRGSWPGDVRRPRPSAECLHLPWGHARGARLDLWAPSRSRCPCWGEAGQRRPCGGGGPQLCGRRPRGAQGVCSCQKREGPRWPPQPLWVPACRRPDPARPASRLNRCGCSAPFFSSHTPGCLLTCPQREMGMRWAC